ncbi:triphosphoribosyl-dephospho-CoA synthase [Segnochrobactrum spirostomi]|uniref:triphosphoribosyl-dephospho-CoA synthase n=1 Tax=Segnochrobactrum spirostomi TaxID=2608987 RepID=UPI001AD8358F|nr:triphosphoribosyl-dephospho-CoA synthase [Segnochrobactrum spirostomi]
MLHRSDDRLLGLVPRGAEAAQDLRGRASAARHPDAAADEIAAVAVTVLRAELAAWPKPGLVSHVDRGSHRDMDAGTLRASIDALHPFFIELAAAGGRAAGMETLRAIGLRAEAAMLAATGGINTHRGAIFGLGLLTAAAGDVAVRRADGSLLAATCLGGVVATRWGPAIAGAPVPDGSHGAGVLRRHGAGGARAEAVGGFRSVYGIGLPALREGRRLAGEAGAAIQACFALIAGVVDTNLLHRGGADGARFAATTAAGFLAAGGVGASDWQAQAAAIHAAFVARNLSPGGCADLLAMTLFVDRLEPDEGAS